MADTWEIVGTIADSVAAIGTTGALIVAAMVYRHQYLDARSAQASRVFVDIDRVPRVDDPHEGMVQVVVRNMSDFPIYYVMLNRFDKDEGWGLVPEDLEPVVALNPHQDHRFNPARLGLPWEVRVGFSDADRRGWVRWASGKLVEQRSPGRWGRLVRKVRPSLYTAHR